MASATRRRTGPVCLLAVQLCKNPDFLAFCSARSADEAADYIRRVCRVGSRAELDHNRDAANAFHELVRKPFAYRRA